MTTKNEVLTKGFTQIPNSVILSGKKLTNNEFRFYSILQYHFFQKDHCYPGRETIAREMGMSIATVDRIKRSVIRKGLIKKTRRGQGLTNLYEPNSLFFSEADESSVISLNESQIKRKEDLVKNTKTYNYLDNQKSFESYKEKQTNSETLTNSSSEVVFRTIVKRIKTTFLNDKNFLKETNIQKSELDLARETLIYYIVKYKAVLGVEHPRYVKDQVERCYLGFIGQVKILRNYGWSLKYVYWVMRDVINRRFKSCKKDENLLRLNSYFGGENNKIFFESLKYVGLE